MELNFERIDNLYVAEFEVASDFNLHIERDTEGRLDIYQRTAGGQYEYINDIGWLNRRLVYDYDFTALVYPKYIKIVTSVLPLVATITTDGEVNELKYQEKTLEITSNGTTKVTPDTGYNGLAQVNVKVDVPTEGGGSVTEDDVLWMNSIYEGFPYLNVSKGMGIDYVTGEYIPLSDDNIAAFSNTFSDGSILAGFRGLENISVSNKSVPKINVKEEDEYGEKGKEGGMFTGITIEGELEKEDGSKETIRGRLVEGLNGVNYGWLLYLTDKQDYFHNVYNPEEYYYYIKITKFIASNGNEVIVPE